MLEGLLFYLLPCVSGRVSALSHFVLLFNGFIGFPLLIRATEFRRRKTNGDIVSILKYLSPRQAHGLIVHAHTHTHIARTSASFLEIISKGTYGTSYICIQIHVHVNGVSVSVSFSLRHAMD